jgi:hypothetical protein
VTIREAWLSWESITVPAYHDSRCSYLHGSRPEWSNCDCGLREAQKASNEAFRRLRNLVLGKDAE